MTCLGSPATGIQLTRSKRTWGPPLQRWTLARPPATRKEKTHNGKKRQRGKKTTPRRKTTTLATIAAANPVIRKRSAQQMARNVTSVGKPATSATCAKVVHPMEVEVEVVDVRNPEVGAIIRRNRVPNQMHNQLFRQSRSGVAEWLPDV